MIRSIVFSIILLLSPIQSFAGQLQGRFANWGVFADDLGSQKICYMLSLPIESSGDYQKRVQSYFLVVNAVDNIDEVTISSGFFYRPGSEVQVSFGDAKFNLFTHKNLAWSYNKNDDLEILKQMRQDLDVVVTAFDKNNKYAIDKYSLIGFKEAYKKMKESCNF